MLAVKKASKLVPQEYPERIADSKKRSFLRRRSKQKKKRTRKGLFRRFSTVEEAPTVSGERSRMQTAHMPPTMPAPKDEVTLNKTVQSAELPVETQVQQVRITKAQKREMIAVFVQTTLKKGVRGLIEEFRALKRTNDPSKMTAFVAQNACGRNRYKDVGCLDNRRVILNIGKVSYIHANYVSTPNHPKRFICTQAPLVNTCPEFWYMVVQEKSEAILMLCNFVEQNVNKCADYFPKEINASLEFDDVMVTCKRIYFFPFPIATKVRIRMIDLNVQIPGQSLHTCTHYHWLDWPDRGVPEADLAPVALLSKLKNCSGPIIVHCSAGIGRTGSIVLIQHALELLHRPAPLLEMRGYLIDLRKERNNSVQTEQQYLYVHQVLLIYLKQTGYLDESTYPYLEQFTKDYEYVTKGF
ncbi:unnamed protein product [Cylicocyclus nassatus]|uniref:Uncharacterized protein n=1 Tax=Cylicocyclus nassatus TaxID=53992 RepID=A0AA36HDH1_CYLNA|nr:unnamed protein product [Cylicocyclus nassatus]